MRALKYPTILITIFFAAGIAAGFFIALPIYKTAIVSGIAFLLLLLCYWQSKKILLQKPYFALAAWAMSFTLGLFSQSLHYGPNYSNYYLHLLSAETTPVLKGVITDRLKPNAFSEKYYFDVQSVNKKTASGKLLVTVPIDSLHTKLQPGDVLYIAGTPVPIQHSLNPGQFDYAAYMAKQDIYGQLRLKDNYIKTAPDKNLAYFIYKFRSCLTESFAIHNYRPATQQMINALLFGQRQDMDAQTNTDYTNAGVVHILAISGLHFSLLFIGLGWLLAPLKRFKQLGKTGHFILLLGVLWIFALITGLSASVVRAAVMVSFVMTGQYFNRNTNIYNSLAVSILVLLIAKPAFLFDVGFQLSYAAVLAIVALQPLYSNLKVSRYKVVNYITDLLVLSVVAQIGVLPLSLYYFHQFPLLFLAANIIVVPLSSIILVLGIAVVLLNFILPPAALLLGKLLELLINWMNSFTHWIASFENLTLKNIPFTFLLNVLLYIIIVSIYLWSVKKSHRRTFVALASILLFQFAYMATVWHNNNKEELVIFNNRKSSLATVKNGNNLSAYSNDSLISQNQVLLAYAKENFNPGLKTLPLRNLLYFKGTKILIIDSTGIYSPQLRPDVVLLTHSPKVNLERLIQQLQPKQFIADATNYKTYVKRWAVTCKKQNIPFHATTEKGYYKQD